MSQENVELVERYWESLDRALERHWTRADAPLSRSLRLEGLFDLVQPDAEWISTFGSETFRGGEQLLRAADDWVEAGNEWRVQAEELIPAGDDRVLSVVRVSISRQGQRGAGRAVVLHRLRGSGRQDLPDPRLHGPQGRPRSRRAAGLGDVAGERGGVQARNRRSPRSP
jgi:ketosteroid isomerase-like protein